MKEDSYISKLVNKITSISQRIKDFRNDVMEAIYKKVDTIKFVLQLTKGLRGNIKKAIENLNKVNSDMESLSVLPNVSTEEIIKEKIFNEPYDPEVLKHLGNGVLDAMALNSKKDMMDALSLSYIKQAIVEISKGKNVAFCSNHLSELDPTFFFIHMLDIDWSKVKSTSEADEYYSNKKAEEVAIKKEAEEAAIKGEVVQRETGSDMNDKDNISPEEEKGIDSIISQMYVVIGNKVRENPYKNYFAKVVNRIFVFQKKSIKSIKEEDTEMVKKMNSFNGRSLVGVKGLKKENPYVSLYIMPAGERVNPKIDDTYVREWKHEDSQAIFRAAKIDLVIPVGIIGTNELDVSRGANGKKMKAKKIHYIVGKPMKVDPEWKDNSKEDLEGVFRKVRSLTTNYRNNVSRITF